MAYHGYKDWTAQNMVTEPRLPGLSYNPEQLFWISAANNYCAKYRSEYLKRTIMTLKHSPGKFRVIGTLSNIKDFAKDFNCPIGSRMNPADKCAMW